MGICNEKRIGSEWAINAWTSLGFATLYNLLHVNEKFEHLLFWFRKASPTNISLPPFQKAKLGLLIGVYLPTMQHIFGVLMFLRLFWMVGIAGVLQTFLIVFVCCTCVSFSSFFFFLIKENWFLSNICKLKSEFHWSLLQCLAWVAFYL